MRAIRIIESTIFSLAMLTASVSFATPLTIAGKCFGANETTKSSCTFSEQSLEASASGTTFGISGAGIGERVYFDGSYTVAVFEDTAGDYDFFYQFDDGKALQNGSTVINGQSITNRAGLGSISAFSMENFAGFDVTAVGYLTTLPAWLKSAGFVTPSSGSTTTFGGLAPNTGGDVYDFGGSIANNQNGDIFVLSTNAATFDELGGFNVQGSGQTTVSAFEPDPPPVPEPSSLTLLGTGLCGLAAILRRRK